ncbi:hypothetical protein P168DRAFT_127258 [Aspergillus campestris IBT 28561]|uniref:Uncharacterized protein n=1 Tax=Aspergillus campestris (strain IBT 28561) TaxID=1392248 RepID=A0A2I1D6U3_ASPC2|nr:uncharacterized protein P168DRAFT_127258 [Aspergillus campestris IBT 28561]PKY05601.1 hypothetical protein P168DRAFT_127258 [Aspergillus campestris IBT 28561]
MPATRPAPTARNPTALAWRSRRSTCSVSAMRTRPRDSRRRRSPSGRSAVPSRAPVRRSPSRCGGNGTSTCLPFGRGHSEFINIMRSHGWGFEQAMNDRSPQRERVETGLL